MTDADDTRSRLEEHHRRLSGCVRCPAMIGPPIIGRPAVTRILQIGQAPGPYEREIGRPFAWTAGKTLFSWYASIGVTEEQVRDRVCLAAVCRCFPGKGKGGGDRVPNRAEILNCRPWMQEEVDLLRPRLIIPVGRLAIAQVLSVARLDEVVGQILRAEYLGQPADVLALPHPSGLSTWFKLEPGKTLLREALQLLADHPVWRATFPETSARS
jgi:uracil-DNA glycosylase